PGLARHARRDDHDVGVGGLVVAVGPGERAVVAVDGPGLGQVQGLAVRDPLEDVHEDDVAQFLLDGVLGDGGADIAGADHADLGAGMEHADHLRLADMHRHHSVSMLWMTAVPNSEHFTSFAPSMSRAKSYVTTFCWMVFSIPAMIRSAASFHPM